MYRITRDFTFSAQHRVEFGEAHQCTELHEHLFTVRVELAAPTLDRRGMVLDFRRELDPFAKLLAERYDGRYLNDLLDQPTSERIAQLLAGDLRGVVPPTEGMRVTVSVSEAPDVWAGYSDD